jgi:hypothetical protein
MGLKEELAAELERTHREYVTLVDTVPEKIYGHPSTNSAWTIGDVLYHITLGPPAILTEIWMIRHMPGLFSALLNDKTAGIFNRGNALFARHPKRIKPQLLIRTYERGHAGLLEHLGRMQESDLTRSVRYPDSFVLELAGVVTVERLFRYIKLHYEVHAAQIRESLG